MAYSLNQILISGNIGRQPELRYTASGTACLNFSIAVTERQKDQKETTMWVPVVLWGKQAEFWNGKLLKGTGVVIQGRVHINSFVDKNEVKRERLEVIASFVQAAQRFAQNPEEVYVPRPSDPTLTEMDIPF